MMDFVHRIFVVIGGLALLLAVLVDTALAVEKRAALVIGNSTYQHVAKLPNPKADANAMGELFKKAGFDHVQVELDVGNLEIKRAIRSFEDAVFNNNYDIAVIFFAGH